MVRYVLSSAASDRMKLLRPLLVGGLLALLPATGLAVTGDSSGKVSFIQKGVFTHPADKGTWKMMGAIVDSGTFVGVCAPCSGRPYVALRRTYTGKRGTFVLLHRIVVPKDSWTMLSGIGFYRGMHGRGTCTVHIVVNEVSFRDPCVGVMTS
jgi:hypothetical protein